MAMIYWHKIKRKIIEIAKANNTPHEIAFGVAIGVFIGITPLYGFHTAMVVLFAMLIPHANKLAILAGTNISIPPTIPLITCAGYNIGRMLLRNKLPSLKWQVLKNITYKDILGFYSTLFLGSIVLGLICAVVFYYSVLFFITRIKKTNK